MLKPILLMLTLILIAPAAAARDPGLQLGDNDLGAVAEGATLRLTLLRRDNFNAHGFDVGMFSILKPGGEEHLSLVPLLTEAGERSTLSTREGADCLLRDFRVRRAAPPATLTLIVAERPLGDDFAAEERVVFTTYALRHNDAQGVGQPYFYFEPQSTQASKAKYCDVGAALSRELGMP